MTLTLNTCSTSWVPQDGRNTSNRPPNGVTGAICEKTKKSASEFMKFLHEGMDHSVSQWCRIYQLEEIKIKAGETPDELVKRIQGLADTAHNGNRSNHIWDVSYMPYTYHHIRQHVINGAWPLVQWMLWQKVQRKSQCGNCTKPHSPSRQHCPAWNSTCSFCH